MAKKEQSAAAASDSRFRRSPDSPSAPSAQRYYQALSLRGLGKNDEAESMLRNLVEAAGQAAAQITRPAAGASPDALQAWRDRAAGAYYAGALGHLGLRQLDEARQGIALALEAGPAHLGARAAQAELSR